MGLQKFKMTVANAVISSENASLDSMGTDQLLDLFELSSHQKIGEGAGSAQLSMAGSGNSASNQFARGSSSNNGVSMKAVLDNLPELWDSTQYEDEYNLDSFVRSLAQ